MLLKTKINIPKKIKDKTIIYVLNGERKEKEPDICESVNRLKEMILTSHFNNVLFYMNTESLNHNKYRSYIKTIKRISRICKENNIEIGITQNNTDTVAVFSNVETNKEQAENMIHSIKIERLKTKKEKYEYIYDHLCLYLDDEFRKNNLCNFENNRCIEKRNTQITCGCCRHYKNRYLGIFTNKLIVCEHLKEKECTAKCLSCKMFTCDTLRKEGISFKLNNMYLSKYYFNCIQKVIIKISLFKTKESILKKIARYGRI